MSRWFRHYVGMMRDEKLVGVAVKAKQPVERVLWVWGAILESAAEINDGGRYDFDAGEAAYFLRCDENDIRAVVHQLGDMERIVDGVVARWGERQFNSDTSKERQRRYRERKAGSHADVPESQGNAHFRQGDVTPPSRDGVVTPQDTDTDTDKKEKHIRAVATATRPCRDEVFEEFWQAYPKRDGANPKQPAMKKFTAAVKSGIDPAAITAGARRYRSDVRSRGQEGTPYVAQAVTWLTQQRWGDYAPQAPPQEPEFRPPEGAPSRDELIRRYGGKNGARKDDGNDHQGIAGDGEGILHPRPG